MGGRVYLLFFHAVSLPPTRPPVYRVGDNLTFSPLFQRRHELHNHRQSSQRRLRHAVEIWNILGECGSECRIGADRCHRVGAEGSGYLPGSL